MFRSRTQIIETSLLIHILLRSRTQNCNWLNKDYCVTVVGYNILVMMINQRIFSPLFFYISLMAIPVLQNQKLKINQQQEAAKSNPKSRFLANSDSIMKN
jgi:hypothetical protein